MLLLVLIAVPVVVGVAAFFLGKRRITPREVAIQVGVVVTLIVIGYYAFRWLGVQDEETWNGRVASAPSGTHSCCHSYDCNCREECSGEGTERSCRQVCDTCYEHTEDLYWEAYSSNGEKIYGSSCHPPGSPAPSEWMQIRIGEPTAVAHRFTNYVRADPDALIRRDPAHARFAEAIPAYPYPVGWKATRLLFVGVAEPRAAELDALLDELNADLGQPKQVNVIVVVVAEADPAYFDALAAAWLGGKKNDVVVVVGAPAYPAIAWARVMAWNLAQGAEDEFKASLARRIELLERFDGEAALAAVRDEVERGYVRRPFSQLDYLLARARPPGWAVIVLFVIGLVVSGLLQWRFWRNERRMTGLAPHARVQVAARRLAAWWRARRG